jgi:hypothetical protein
MGSYNRLQTGLFVVSQGDMGSKWNGHGPAPEHKGETAKHAMTMLPILRVRSAKIYWHRIYEMDI